MSYIKLNLNPTGKATSDCVIRAIMKATDKTWEQVYKELCRIGLDEYAMPNDKRIYNYYLETNGFKKKPMPKRTSGDSYKRYTVEEFAMLWRNGTYIVKVANHLTVVKQGIIYDIWNCSHKYVGNYWEKLEYRD